VFFLQIGVEADLEVFTKPELLAFIGAALVVAICTKVFAGVGLLRAPGDKLMVGLGMLPRGEVGLIFASIGLTHGVLDADLYGAVVAVVLGTTLLAPPLLRWRIAALTRRHRQESWSPPPPGGWLRVTDEVALAGEPPDDELLVTALDAALLVARVRPSSELLDWLGRTDADQAKWDGRATTRLLTILRDGDARSWRFLETSGVLERTLPELASVLRARRDDPFLLDPAHVLRFDLVERMRDIVHHDPRAAAAFERLRHPERPLLAAFVIAATGGVEPEAFAGQLWNRLRLGSRAETELVALVADRDLLRAIAHRVDGLDEEPLLHLAAHLETAERARALYVLSLALGELDEPTRDRLDELLARILRVQAQSELTGPSSVTVIEARRAEALALLDRAHGADEWVRSAPRAYLLSTPAADVARHAALLEPLPRRGTARVSVTTLPGGSARIELTAADRPGLVAVVSGVLTKLGFDVTSARMTTWSSGAALQSFDVQPLPGRIGAADATSITNEIEAAFDQPLTSPPLPDIDVSFDDDASPWYTLCEIRSRNRPGLLHAVATGFAAVGVSIHAARIDTRSDVAIDRFEVTDTNGAKLDDVHQRAATAAIHGGVSASRPTRRRWSGMRARA